MPKYDHLSKDELVRLLAARDRRDATRFGLVWEANEIDRDKAINSDFVALDLVPDQSVGAAPWRNLIIEGDNFDALRYLRMTYAGRVKCILIDPPYNTGSSDFIYNDRFVDASDSWRYSTWIEFLYQRLIIARDLLRQDGVLLCCINDENRSKLELLLDKVMPGRRVGSFVWRTRSGARVSKNHFVSVDQEYILCYANNDFSFAGSAKTFADYGNPDNDPRGDWANFNLTKGQSYKERPRSYFPLQNPKSGIWYACNPDRVWAFSSEAKIKAGQRLLGLSMEQVVREEKVLWPIDDKVATFKSIEELMTAIDAGTAPRHIRRGLPDLEFWVGKPVGYGMPRYKMHKRELDAANNPLSTWISTPDSDEAKSLAGDTVETMQSGFTAEGATLVTAMLGTKEFSYPKPLSLIQSLVQQCASSNDLVMDFFSGSGTTAHAVLAQNAEDDQSRRFIMVSSTEATDKESNKNVCRDVCRRRIAAAIEGYSFAQYCPKDSEEIWHNSLIMAS
jgi:adenine-specific DNA-methyltransferase